MSDPVVVVSPVENVIVIQPELTNVVISGQGQQGPPGVFNPADIFYTHIQAIAANVWTINHNLRGYPTAVVLDSAGTQCEGTFSYPSINQMVITFSGAFTGTAYVV
jgi:hypothetical protein